MILNVQQKATTNWCSTNCAFNKLTFQISFVLSIYIISIVTIAILHRNFVHTTSGGYILQETSSESNISTTDPRIIPRRTIFLISLALL
uniref:Uncharacterized protein n=1 Tax=Poecilia latipinna TaxID=48699 RepID=A0A3B3TU35_9TELE